MKGGKDALAVGKTETADGEHFTHAVLSFMREKTESLLDVVTVAVAPRLLSLGDHEPKQISVNLCKYVGCAQDSSVDLQPGETISFTKHLVF